MRFLRHRQEYLDNLLLRHHSTLDNSVQHRLDFLHDVVTFEEPLDYILEDILHTFISHVSLP